MTITERLSTYMNHKGLNPNKLTIKASLSVGLIGKSLKNNKGLNSDTIEKILHSCKDLNPEWFIIGAGEMIKQGNDDILNNPKSDNTNITLNQEQINKLIETNKSLSNTLENLSKKL